MLPLLCIALLTTTATFSLTPMEITEKKNKKQFKKLKKTPSLSSLKKQTPTTIIPDHQFISAARLQEHGNMMLYLKNPYFNPNIQNQSNNTAIHCSALAKDYVGVQILLNDPRVNSSIKNDENKTARELIKGNETSDVEMRRKLFARVTLDTITNQECEKIKFSTDSQGFITPTTLSDTIRNIKNKIVAVETKQADSQELPTSACFPTYATDEFLEKKVYFHITQITQ